MTYKPYSPMERKLLDAIPDDGTMVNTLDLVRVAYEGEAPLTARQSVLDAANKLIRKIDWNVEPYEILRSKPCGPQPIYFWKVPRQHKVSDDLFMGTTAA